MADTYEKDLGQKSSLTASDFIRVVGSDNVSYKQNMSSVMETMGLGTAINNGTDLNTLVLPTNDKKIKVYRGENLSQMTNKPSGVTSAWPFCLMLLPIGGAYTKQILHIYGTDATPDYVYVRTQTYSSGGVAWTDWQQSPTRAEIDALNTHAPTTSTLGTLDLNTLPTDKPMRIYLQNVGNNATVERHYPAAQVAGFLLHFRASDWILQVYFGFGVSKIYYRQWYDTYGTVPGWSTIS